MIGLSAFLYPFVADYVNSFRQSRVVAQYYTDLATLNKEDFTELFTVAKVYNEELINKSERFSFSGKDAGEYEELLNPFGNGIMGTLNIKRIGVRLPIYHGTSESVLQTGVGHFEGSSLPVGGPGTHSVITGHRGLPSSTLLTKLDKMHVGDTFVLHILNETLTYQIDQILVVVPEDMRALAIEPGKDYCTLVTCTPYGINSHRMMLRGSRIPNVAELGIEEPDAAEIDSLSVAAVIFLPVLIVVAAYLVIRLNRIYRFFGRRKT